MNEFFEKFHKEHWLKIELSFIEWLYKYKNFLGRLKLEDFKQFDSREEAMNTWINEIIHEVRREKYEKKNKKKT